MVAVDERAREVRRLLDRYLVEIVEAFELCPWAKPARTGGELAVEILWGTPTGDAWLAAATRAFADPAVKIAMLVAPQLAIARTDFHAVRDALAKRAGTLGIAEFHPDAPYDAKSPARLVPFLRRSPDPLLQCVPLALLDQVRGPSLDVTRSEQIAMLVKAGGVHAVKPPIADRIAATNHARVDEHTFEATLARILADRRDSYARVGIT